MIQPPTPAHTRRRSVTAVRLPAERWESLLAAAVRPAGPGTGTGADPLALDTSAHLGLRRLAAVLPPALEAARDPELLATVSAVTALADPRCTRPSCRTTSCAPVRWPDWARRMPIPRGSWPTPGPRAPSWSPNSATPEAT